MKKTILLGTLLFTLISTQSFAGWKDMISEEVKASFRHEFVDAEDVQWEDSGSFIKVSFKLASQSLSAYFDAEGNLLAVTRYISPDHLPIHLLLLLRAKYPDYWITDLLEMNNGQYSTYFAAINNGDKEVMLKSIGDGNWHVVRKTRITTRK